MNAEDDFENDYLRYGGAVGVRNPRLVRYLCSLVIQDWCKVYEGLTGEALINFLIHMLL